MKFSRDGRKGGSKRQTTHLDPPPPPFRGGGVLPRLGWWSSSPPFFLWRSLAELWGVTPFAWEAPQVQRCESRFITKKPFPLRLLLCFRNVGPGVMLKPKFSAGETQVTVFPGRVPLTVYLFWLFRYFPRSPAVHSLASPTGGGFSVHCAHCTPATLVQLNANLRDNTPLPHTTSNINIHLIPYNHYIQLKT